jgi:hypothetical protein
LLQTARNCVFGFRTLPCFSLHGKREENYNFELFNGEQRVVQRRLQLSEELQTQAGSRPERHKKFNDTNL